jgi:hypothetical protein
MDEKNDLRGWALFSPFLWNDTASNQQGIADKISDPVFRSFMQPHGRNVDRTLLNKRGLLIIHDPGPDDRTINPKAVSPRMHPHELFPADNEPAAGLDRDAANAQVDDIHDMIIIQPDAQAVQLYFERLILSLIPAKSAIGRPPMILQRQFAQTATCSMLPVHNDSILRPI